MTTRQVQFDGPGKLQMVTRQLPPLGDTQVLVKVEYCGLCTWERHIYEGVEHMPFPFVGGHEIAATVVDKGCRVGADIAAGAPVAVAKWLRCNQCQPCRRGYDNHCEQNDAPASQVWSGPGGFSEYLICEGYEVFPFLSDLPLQYAALAEPVACVTRAVSAMDVVPGDTVAVIGAGLMGLLFLKLLHLRGCRVLVVQRSAARREMAAAMGADAVIDPSVGDWWQAVRRATGGKGAAAVAYTAGGGAVLNQCLRSVRVGGTVMLYAPTHESGPSLDADVIHFQELKVTGALRHDKESFRQAVCLLADGLVDGSDLRLSTGRFENMEAEMQRANQNRDIHRILLQWD